ncbi:thermonuclease family protein [Desulfovirgula thermocuniculi]|uniref:thermonuclease family protein n=1 Tax=Desulfovirgula thermocuniculi TaxID=348842 RepID=UPI000407242B|nr:thermonuclease family protein [Desulfovirgula thermocuniculi]
MLISAKVIKVVDGDTINVNIDGKDETVRLIGVDTPETHHPSQPVEPYGPEAENFTRSQLDGKTVYLEKDVQERDKYGRLLAYVWVDKPTEISDQEIRAKMFNARLLLDGYAQLYTVSPNVKYVDYFRTYQTEAREANKGLWALGPVPNAPPASSSQNVQASSGSVQAASAGGQVQDQKEITVYVTRTGKKYHMDGCRYLAKSKIPMSLSEAKAAGYEPCSVCNPPR